MATTTALKTKNLGNGEWWVVGTKIVLRNCGQKHWNICTADTLDDAKLGLTTDAVDSWNTKRDCMAWLNNNLDHI